MLLNQQQKTNLLYMMEKFWFHLPLNLLCRVLAKKSERKIIFGIEQILLFQKTLNDQRCYSISVPLTGSAQFSLMVKK